MAMYCSFCGKSPDDVAEFIDGNGVNICSECLDQCNRIIESHRRTKVTQEQTLSSEHAHAAASAAAQAGSFAADKASPGNPLVSDADGGMAE